MTSNVDSPRHAWERLDELEQRMRDVDMLEQRVRDLEDQVRRLRENPES